MSHQDVITYNFVFSTYTSLNHKNRWIKIFSELTKFKFVITKVSLTFSDTYETLFVICLEVYELWSWKWKKSFNVFIITFVEPLCTSWIFNMLCNRACLTIYLSMSRELAWVRSQKTIFFWKNPTFWQKTIKNISKKIFKNFWIFDL